MNRRIWVNISILNLCIVALLGLMLRSKMLFTLPIINYNHLLESHSHFAFGGWGTLSLIILMVYELLPVSFIKRPIYQWIFGGLVITSWSMLLSYFFEGNNLLSVIISLTFILVTYIFGWIFLKDIQKSIANKTIRILVLASVFSLILSSAGPITLDYLFSVRSRNAILYRDALYTYLHLQYNGFFTLSVFSLLFHKLESNITIKVRQNIHRFSVLLIISILPSLFLSYLWYDPNRLFHIIAIVGSFIILLSLIWFIIISKSLIKVSRDGIPIIRYMVLISISAFVLKMFLQSCTIFSNVGNAVFGDRPLIIGFLHLVFLAFVSLFILAYFAQAGIFNVKSRFTRLALIVFSLSVIINEVILFGQGLGAMFIKSSFLIPWLLWGTSALLFIGSLMIGMARIKFSELSKKYD